MIRVAGWSAEGASVDEVIEQIRKHEERPLKITFATPEPEDDDDEDEDEDEDDDDEEEVQERVGRCIANATSSVEYSKVIS